MTTRLSEITRSIEFDGGARAAMDFAICKALCRSTEETWDAFASRNPSYRSRIVEARKAAVGAVDMNVSALGAEAAALLALWAPQTILGQLRESVPGRLGGVPVQQTLGAEVVPVAEGRPAPCRILGYENLASHARKFGCVVPISKELARLGANPPAQRAIEIQLQRAHTRGLDRYAFDPSLTGSLTNGAPEIAVGADVELDLGEMLRTVSGGHAEAPYFVANLRVAIYLSTLRSSGVRVFPDVTARGGTLMGIPLLVGASLPDVIVAVDATGIVVGDGGLELDSSDATAIEMLDASLQQNGTNGTGAQLVSMWQTNMLGILIVHYMNWARRDDAVVWRQVPLSGSPA